MFAVGDKVKVHGKDGVVNAVHSGGKKLAVYIAAHNVVRYAKAADVKAAS